MDPQQNPHRCRLVKNKVGGKDWVHWRLWYYEDPTPGVKRKRQFVDIPGAWNSTTGWRYSQYVEQAIRNNYPLDRILAAARGNLIINSSEKKRR